MSHLNQYTLKGYFAQLKEDVERKYEISQDRQTNLPTDNLLALIQKSVAIIEDIYREAPEILSREVFYDYAEMVRTLNANGRNYAGRTELLAKAGDQWKLSHNIEKKPMQKAAGKPKNSTADDTRQKTGTHPD